MKISIDTKDLMLSICDGHVVIEDGNDETGQDRAMELAASLDNSERMRFDMLATIDHKRKVAANLMPLVESVVSEDPSDYNCTVLTALREIAR